MIPKPILYITFCLFLLLSTGGYPDTSQATSAPESLITSNESSGPSVKKEPASAPENPHMMFGWQWRAAAGTAGEIPFWLHSNRMGQIDRYSANTTLNLSGSWHRTLDSGIRLSTATNVLFRGSGDAVIRLQEGYIQAAYGHYVLGAGRKREDFGLVHPELSMGTMDHSDNIRPMPKIYFATDGFQFIPGTQRVFYYDAGLAHGWMDDDRYRFVDDVLLHQKHLYLRMFTEEAPVVPRAGLIHFAQWGGNSPKLGQAPVNWRAYRDVFFSLASDSKEILEGGELANHFQNHFGVYDFSLMTNIGKYRVAISRQFILEDTPNARFGTPWDGMWGAFIERRPDSRTRWRAERPSDWRTEHRPPLKAIVYEHINTIEGIDRYPHRDMTTYFNYYNHWAYRGGWAYEGRVIGNPLFFSDREYMGVINNLLLAHHFGAMGHAGPLDWRFFTTYSRNYGASRLATRDGERVSLPNDRRDQWSLMVELQAGAYDLFDDGAARAGSRRSGSESWLKPLSFTVTLGYDTGEVYSDNFGMMLGLRWHGSGF